MDYWSMLMKVNKYILGLVSLFVLSSCSSDSDPEIVVEPEPITEPEPVEREVIPVVLNAELNGSYTQFFLTEELKSDESNFNVNGEDVAVHIEPLLGLASVQGLDSEVPLFIDIVDKRYSVTFTYEQNQTLPRPLDPVVYVSGCSYIAGDI